MNSSFVYTLQCADGSIYTGWTNDVEKRVDQHNCGKGAKYTRGRRPVTLLTFWTFATKSEALKFEVWLKGLPKNRKQQIIGEQQAQ